MEDRKVKSVMVIYENGETEMIDSAILLSKKEEKPNKTSVDVRLINVSLMDIAEIMMHADETFCLKGILESMSSDKCN